MTSQYIERCWSTVVTRDAGQTEVVLGEQEILSNGECAEDLDIHTLGWRRFPYSIPGHEK